MKILIALHQCMDLGGIINHTEQLIGGLKDLGHKVDLKEFVWAKRAVSQRREGNFLIGPSGIPHHQGKGWNFDQRNRIAYRGNALVMGAIQQMKQYDLIIWTVPVPSKSASNRGNADWPRLYETGVKQIAFMHDGNAPKGNAHILAIQDHLDGLACVHPCALNGSSFTTIPRALVVNPQDRPLRAVHSWQRKYPGFVNMQTFKAWKHVHELIESIRYMPKKREDELREVAGRGIEYQYMTSEDKCKDAYFHEDGVKFWDAALANGMNYHGYWDTEEVDLQLQTARVLVDPSWSNNYSKFGGHFNRVVVDAMIRGCVPVAREMGMGNEIFKAGQHYIAIPEGSSPEKYADIVLETSHMDVRRAEEIQDQNRLLLGMFDRQTVAQRVIDLAHGNIETEIGKIDPRKLDKVQDQVFQHFGVFF